MRRFIQILSVLFVGCGLLPVVSAQETQVDDPGTSPKYPRVNLAPTYAVDSKWPDKPEEYEWAAVSGVAVDKKDRVWIFTRSTPPIQVYSADGKLIRAWGDKTRQPITSKSTMTETFGPRTSACTHSTRTLI